MHDRRADSNDEEVGTVTFIYIIVGIGIFGLIVAGIGALISEEEAVFFGCVVAGIALVISFLGALMVSDTRDSDEREQKQTACVEQGKIWYTGNEVPKAGACLTNEQVQILKQ